MGKKRLYVSFEPKLKSYCVEYHRFIDNDEPHLIPMNERPQNIKHSAKYGHWQAETKCDIDIELHNAIHQQMKELGWI